MRFLGLFLLAGLAAEIVSIVLVADWIGGLATFGLMILSFVSGGFILRRTAGFAKVLMAGEMMRGGGMSVYQLLWPVRIPLAAVLLMLPGFLSSLAAVLLLLPFKGKPLVANSGQTRFTAYGTEFGGYGSDKQGDVIDSEDYVVRESGRTTRKGRQQDVIEHQP